MEEVTVSRDVAAEPGAIRAGFEDVAAFMRAAGFDEVDIEGDRMAVSRAIGLAELSLTLEAVETDAEFACEQVEGMFEEMRTTYRFEGGEDGTTVTAQTEFELGGVVGAVLDATLIKRKRTQELEDQLAYLDRVATDTA
ncbi:Polyketide cyclase / dehydrase [Halorhabdus tiamatea SARL4B]|uniref:Polyketide cyclase / dehydrase n=1 Tax=Halorhabdus tiamatea SARL4B TaxID=1033806 RepID=S6D2J5_9EURY|nr:SRPBCC family protein [Halorhabdus tiamatea]ERJ05418.1 Polyketide cyclase / dehydrase [Halorhabdus tiamatea SARL4B]CCQ33355.1 conserved hypothetical protein [Halorhabdus tiamatea SARL4B]